MPPPPKKREPSKLRLFFFWTFRITALVIILILLIIGYTFRADLYKRFVRFPKEAKAWAAIKADRQEVTLDDGWTDYRGPIHNHSFISHDSMVSFEEILATLKETDCDFIFMADHCVDNIADFKWQWRGLKDGILFVPGFEMDYGFMPFGVDSTVRLKKDDPPLEPGGQVFHVQFDPYERMVRFVGNHILAKELTEEALLESFKQGRVFISFDMLADGRGFIWTAQNGEEQAVMGESMTYQEGITLRAAAPQACRFIVVKDGNEVHRAEGRNLDWHRRDLENTVWKQNSSCLMNGYPGSTRTP